MPSHRTTTRTNVNGVEITSQKYVEDGADVNVGPVPIGHGATNVELTLVLDVSQAKSVFMVATVDMTVKVNSSGSPTETLHLKANEEYEWHTNSLHALVLETDITKVYVSNPGSEDGTFRFHAIYDPTP